MGRVVECQLNTGVVTLGTAVTGVGTVLIMGMCQGTLSINLVNGYHFPLALD